MELLRTIAPVREHCAVRRTELSFERPSGKTFLKVIDDVSQLFDHRHDLEDLAAELAVQNVSYEPWVLFPLVRASAERRTFLFLLIFETATSHKSRLIGFFPFERIMLHPFIPLSCLRLWADPFNYVNARCDPLIRKGCEYCIDVLFDWFKERSGQSDLMNLRGMTDGTSIARSVEVRLSKDMSLSFIQSTIESHLYRRQLNAQSYIDAVLSRKSQQTLRRYERRLRDTGPIEYADVAECSDIGNLVDEFIALEDQGWKGKQGVSIASYGHKEWVKHLLLDAHDRKRLSLLTMRVGGRLIAARCVLLAKPGSFLFKLTYDEDDLYAKRSPGLLLELEAIRRMHSDAELLGNNIDWLDTCSSPYSPIFSRSRSEALRIHRFVVTRKWTVASFALAAFHAHRQANKLVQECRTWVQS